MTRVFAVQLALPFIDFLATVLLILWRLDTDSTAALMVGVDQGGHTWVRHDDAARAESVKRFTRAAGP